MFACRLCHCETFKQIFTFTFNSNRSANIAFVAGAAAGAVTATLPSPARLDERADELHCSSNQIHLTCESPTAYKDPPDPALSAETF